MNRDSLLIFATCALLLFAPVVRAQDANFWAFLEQGRVITRCPESSKALAQATERLQRLDERIQGVASSATAADLIRELHDLLKTECFLPAAETTRVPKPDTTLSLTDWWSEAGGREWLASLLEFPRLGPIDHLTPHVVVPPDSRKTLNIEANRDHPLSGLLCPLNDSACGRETRGWRQRAEAYFQANRASIPHDVKDIDARRSLDPNDISQECAKETSDADASLRYGAWRACVEGARPVQMALPLGGFKAPTSGWLVIAGRRGHYEFCDTTRAYDLSTGAAFADDSCSALALKPGGDVDFDVTNKGRVRRVQAGTVSIDNLREAVWMLLFRGEAEQIQLGAQYYPLPTGISPQLTVRHTEDELFEFGNWATTAQTVLTWRWIPESGRAFVGEVTWPNSSDAAESHAASLLGIAEEGFVERCPPRGVPAAAVLAPSRAQNLNEVPGDAIRELDRDLRGAMQRWTTLPVCGSSR
jgi:hypothetical protein